MLKYNDPDNNTVIDTVTGQVTAQGYWGWEAWLQPRLDAGETIAPWKTDAELLEETRAAKIAEIDAAFALAEQQPVGVGGYKFKGGFTSALALDGERRGIIEENNAIIAGFLPEEPPPGSLHTTVTFFTVDGDVVQVPLFDTEQIDAVDVCQAVRMQASYNSFKCAQLIAAARAATTIEAINAIKW